MRIQHNIMAMNAYRNYNNNTSALSKNLEKLSSGYKINRAGDDAAGLAISEKMRAQITGLNAAQKNVKDGVSLVKTAEGAMQEIQDMLNRMDYLATQSANGTYDDEVDRANLQKEVVALKEEINRIADSANFNGIKLLNGDLERKQLTAAVEGGTTYAPSETQEIKILTGDATDPTTEVGQKTVLKTGSTPAQKTELTANLENIQAKTLQVGDKITMTIGGANAATKGATIELEVVADADANAGTGKIKAGDYTATELATAFKAAFDGGDKKVGGQEFTATATGGTIAFAQKANPKDNTEVVDAAQEIKVEFTQTNVVPPKMKDAPTVTVDATDAAGIGAANVSFAFNGTATDDQKVALNEALKDGSELTFTLAGITAGNKLDAGNTTITVGGTLPTGYTMKYTDKAGTAHDVGTTGIVVDDAGTGTEIGNSAAFDIYKGTDKIGTLTVNLGAGDTASSLNNGATKVTLGQNAFEAGAAAADNTATGASTVTNADYTSNTATTAVADGTKYTVNVGGTDYSVTVKTTADADAVTAGTQIAAGTMKNDEVLAAVAAAVQKQLDAAAKTAAAGTADYTKYTALNLTGDNAGVITATVQKTEMKYAAGEVGNGELKHTWNVGSTNNQQGNAAIDGERASTAFTLTADMVKDGNILTIGDNEYVFKVGKDSTTKVTDATKQTLIDLSKYEAGDAKLVDAAGIALSKQANKVFDIGYIQASDKVTIHEKVDNTLHADDLAHHDTFEALVNYREKDVATTTEAKEATYEGNPLTLQIGDTSDKFNQMAVSIGDMHTKAMFGLQRDNDGNLVKVKDENGKDVTVNSDKSIAGIDISTQEGAQDAVTVIKDAINYVSGIRGDLGAIQNRLEHTQNNLSVMAENIQDAESTIRDTDVAEEMMSYVKNNILVQSAQAMLAQANQVPQGVLQLLG